MPKAATTAPVLSDLVLVRTPGSPIDGQEEHAGIVTRVNSPTNVNVSLFRATDAGPLHFPDLEYDESPTPTETTWHWPADA